MDSLTQMLLGSCVAAVVAPAEQARKALLVGAMLGTVPDLDNLYFQLVGSDVVTEITWHRGPTHSLFVLLIFGGLLWWGCHKYTDWLAPSPQRWLWAIWLALLTHPLLDAFTVYGTQLLWPIPMPPVMWSSIYVIDPLYTLPLLLAVVLAYALSLPRRTTHTLQPNRRSVGIQYGLILGLLLSSSYLAWSVVAKLQVERLAEQSLLPLGLAKAPRLSTPLPVTTLSWRVIVLDQRGYWIADHVFLQPHMPLQFKFYPSDFQLLAQIEKNQPLQRLLWFTHGFVGISQQQGSLPQLILSDLRMGLEPDYLFKYAIASRDADGQWRMYAEIRRLDASHARQQLLKGLWQRLIS
jgi:inner membrane protein